MTTKADIQIFGDRLALAQAAALLIVSLSHKAIETNGTFRLVLSGGSTPRPLHQILSQSDMVEQMDWAKIHVFWGDERCVPPDDPESNYRMAAETLLNHVPIPASHIHRIHGELSPQLAADDYQRELAAQFGQSPGQSDRPFPRFDLILLGLGPDGHTASLFPGSEALEEKQRWVVPVPHEHGPEPLVPRVSLTLPVIQAAHQIIFLVSGANKAGILAEVLSPPMGKPLPAQLARLSDGRETWMIDRASASKLEPI